MSACNFTIEFSDSAESMVQKAQTAILNAENATFEGTTQNGIFALPTPLGAVKGSYIIENNLAHFTIDEKPFLVSCNLIESKLKGYINPVS